MAAYFRSVPLALKVQRSRLCERSICSSVQSLCSKELTSKGAENKITHTGQQWSKDDARMLRFMYGPKQVNESFAIDLIDEMPPKPVKERVTWCNGGGGALGHPKVFINLDQPGPQACGYCGLRFVLEKDHH